MPCSPTNPKLWRNKLAFHVRISEEDQINHYSLVVSSSYLQILGKDKSLDLSTEEARIAWTMRVLAARGTEDWVSTDHFSTLDYGAIPETGAAFAEQLILHLKREWLLICHWGDQHLNATVNQGTFPMNQWYFINPSNFSTVLSLKREDWTPNSFASFSRMQKNGFGFAKYCEVKFRLLRCSASSTQRTIMMTRIWTSLFKPWKHSRSRSARNSQSSTKCHRIRYRLWDCLVTPW